MSTPRATIMALLALILATAAFVNSLLPIAPGANAAPSLQDAPAQAVDAAGVQALAAIAPSQIGYDGILRDAAGAPLTGTYSVTFRIYDSLNPTAPAIWAESHPTLTVRSGVFSVLLGNGKLLPGSQPLANAFNGTDRYLGVRLQGFAEMIPRQRFASVPYAIKANSADTAGSANTAGHANTAGRANSAAIADTLVPGAIINGSHIEVHNSNHDGFRVINAAATGFFVENANFGFLTFRARDVGVIVNAPGGRGLVIEDSGSTGIDIFRSGWHGLYIDGTGSDGIVVHNPGGYAAYFGGAIRADRCDNCQLAIFGRNAGQNSLEPGDLVSVQSFEIVDFQKQPVVNVGVAQNLSPIVGVVISKAEVKEQEKRGKALVPSTGLAQPGEYVHIITYGLAQVKASAVGGSIKAGALLAVGEQPGQARLLNASAMQASGVNGVPSTVGTAMQNAESDQGLIWVLVNPR